MPESEDAEGYGWRHRTDDAPLSAEEDDTEGHRFRWSRTEDAPVSAERDDAEDVGREHLKKHLVEVVTLMRISPNWNAFMRHFARAFPAPTHQLAFDLSEDDEDNEE